MLRNIWFITKIVSADFHLLQFTFFLSIHHSICAFHCSKVCCNSWLATSSTNIATVQTQCNSRETREWKVLLLCIQFLLRSPFDSGLLVPDKGFALSSRSAIASTFVVFSRDEMTNKRAILLFNNHLLLTQWAFLE